MLKPMYRAAYFEARPGDVHDIPGTPASTPAFVGRISRGPNMRTMHARDVRESTRIFGGLRKADRTAPIDMPQAPRTQPPTPLADRLARTEGRHP